MSIHSGQTRSLSLHQKQPTASAGHKPVVGYGAESGQENPGWSSAAGLPEQVEAVEW